MLKKTLIIIGVVVLCVSVYLGGIFLKEKKAQEVGIQETVELDKQAELLNAYESGIKRIYDLTNNCQIAMINFGTTTKSLLDVSCAKDIMLRGVEEAKNNCPKCEACKPCE